MGPGSVPENAGVKKSGTTSADIVFGIESLSP
jgi:hypothetical protein